MVSPDYIDLGSLTMDELAGVVHLDRKSVV